jgi:PPOX class probable F420-dependent enzyme
MRLDPEQCRRRAGSARFAVLATRAADGTADLVPITFALVDHEGVAVIVTAVDHKPKTTTRLARLANIGRDPHVTVLFDHRDDEDWSTLWWVRAVGRASVRPAGTGVAALVARYGQYREVPPQGPVIEVAVERWLGWAASGSEPV